MEVQLASCDCHVGPGPGISGSTRGELKQATGSLADNMPAREKSEKQKAIEEEESVATSPAEVSEEIQNQNQVIMIIMIY